MREFVFVFDLDYTLLDTEAFKHALREAVCAFGPSVEAYEKAYDEVVHRAGSTYDYDPDAHIAAMADAFPDGASATSARRAIQGVLTRTADFLMPGAETLLARLRDRSEARLVLLTLGNRSWQSAKVQFSRLKELFDEVVATEVAKVEVAAHFGQQAKRVVIINDNGDELGAMSEQYPSYEYVPVRGPKGLPSQLRAASVSSMKELAARLSQLTGWNLEG